MRNKLLVYILLLIASFNAYGQVNEVKINELKEELLKAKNDSTRLWFANQLASGYRFSNVDSSFHYNDIALKLSTKLNLPSNKANLLSLKGATLLESGKLPESLQFQFEALNISEQIKDTSTIAYALNRIGNTYMELGNYKKANTYYFRSRDLFHSINEIGMYHNEVSNIGNIYELMKIPDSALYYQQIVHDYDNQSKEHILDRKDITHGEIMFRMGNAHKSKGNNEEAMGYYKRGITESLIDNDLRNLSMNNLLIAELYKEMNQPDSSMKYAVTALKTARTVSFRKCIYEASTLISKLYKNRNEYDSAYNYLITANVEKDSLTGTERFQVLQQIILDEQEQKRKEESQRIAKQNRDKQYALLAGLAFVLLIASLLYRNNKQKQKTNSVLQEQKQKVESTLQELKATQGQLIQSEKMASLGELTAGIAHEIQNPLNFVNNFSEVSKELIEEMLEEIKNGDMEEVNAIAQDVIQNLEKINHHGKRADGIVKGMLQHSRSSSGTTEPTDINVLVDEYLRLAYHGLRAKDKSFNAALDTKFDESIETINIVPQDIGRVVLNLITNAFYACNEKKKLQPEGFEPKVTVGTKKIKDNIEIHVQDNGNGIPKKVLDKIFQPFFTTKPAGQGTGLGLSLSYDIIKSHGGNIKVNTEENQGTEFIISLPTD